MYRKILVREQYIFLFFLLIFSSLFFLYTFFIRHEVVIELKSYIKVIFLILYILLILISGNILRTTTVLFFILSSLGIRWWIYYWIPTWKFYDAIAISLFDIVSVFILFVIIISKLNGSFKPKKIPLSFILLLLTIIFTISTLNSKDLKFSFLYIFIWLSSYILFLTIWIICDSKKNLEYLLFAILTSLFIREIIGFAQLTLGYIPILKSFSLEVQTFASFWKTRIRGGFTHPNAYAGILSLATTLTIGILLSKRYTRRIKIILLLFCILSIIQIFFTYSRTGYISLFVISVSFYLYHFYHQKKLLVASFVLLILLFIILFIIKIVLPEVFLRILSIFWGEKDLGIFFRIYLWENTIKVIKSHLLFGIGINQFIFQKFSLGYTHAHNYYITILLETGIGGLFLLLILLLKPIFVTIKTIRREKKIENKYLWFSILLGWVLISIHFITTGFWIANFASIEMKYLFSWFAISFLLFKHYRDEEKSRLS